VRRLRSTVCPPIPAFTTCSALWAGLGHAARDGYAALGLQPAEVRLADTGAMGSLARPVFGACLGAPLRLIDTSAPATAGAALVAAISLGHYRDLADGFAEWVEPRLSQIRAVGRDLDSSCAPASPAPASA
jgi:erythritol kinase